MIWTGLAAALITCQPVKNTNEQAGATETSSRQQIIVDVRSPEEWTQDGHAACTINIPLPELESKLSDLKNYDKIILVCRSGNRAGAAKEQLEQAGFKNVENAGAWQNVNCN